jgi:hypothetical protein
MATPSCTLLALPGWQKLLIQCVKSAACAALANATQLACRYLVQVRDLFPLEALLQTLQHDTNLL